LHYLFLQSFISSSLTRRVFTRQTQRQAEQMRTRAHYLAAFLHKRYGNAREQFSSHLGDGIVTPLPVADAVQDGGVVGNWIPLHPGKNSRQEFPAQQRKEAESEEEESGEGGSF